MSFKVGDKVKCNDGETGVIKTACTQCKWHVTIDNNGGVRQIYNEDELKLIQRAIRDVKEGDTIIFKDTGIKSEDTVLAVGKDGFCTDYTGGCWYTWEDTEDYDLEIKQPDKQEIEIADKLRIITCQPDAVKNRNLIIELQKQVNKLVKE